MATEWKILNSNYRTAFIAGNKLARSTIMTKLASWDSAKMQNIQ